MSLFPLISVPDPGTADGTLPLPREVAWDFGMDQPIWRGGNPVFVTGADAVLVWAWNAIKTERYRHDVFTHAYGQDIAALVGKPYSEGVRQSEAVRCIREALMISPYVEAVDQVSVQFLGSELKLSFMMKTIYGEVTLKDGTISI